MKSLEHWSAGLGLMLSASFEPVHASNEKGHFGGLRVSLLHAHSLASESSDSSSLGDASGMSTRHLEKAVSLDA